MKRSFALILILILMAGCIKHKPQEFIDEPDVLFNKAITLYKKGKYEKAAEKFLEFKNRYPLDPRIREAEIKYADSLYHAKKYIEAEEAYLQFIKFHPKNKFVPYCYYQLGMCEFKQISTIDRDQSKVESSYKYFKKIVENYPDTRFAVIANHRILECKRKMAKYNFYVGYFYYKQGNYDAAIYRFKKILKKYPGFIDDKVIFYLAKCYMNQKKPYEAKRLFDKLLQTFPKSKYRFEAMSLVKTLKPEKITLWRRIKDYYFRFESDIGDKYYIPGYKRFAYPPSGEIENILASLQREKRTIVTFKTSPVIKREFIKAETQSKRKTSKKDRIPINISANNVSYMKNGLQVVFEGNVVATRGDFTLKCDKIVALLDKSKKIKKIEAQGNVEIIYMTSFARANKVEYFIAQNKIVLSGNPYIKDRKAEVRGEKIVYYLKSNQIFIQGSMKKRGEIVISP